MSFWDRLGAAAGDFVTTATGLGTVWDIAHAAKDEADALGLSKIMQAAPAIAPAVLAGTGLGAFTRGNTDLKAATATAADPQGFSLLDAAHAPYDYGVGRTMGTAALVKADVLNGRGSLTDLNVWRRDWNASDKTSVGQATMGFYGAVAGNIASALGGDRNATTLTAQSFDAGTAQGREYFSDTTSGRITSGALDLFSNLALDPLYGAGKATKALRATRTTFGGNAARDAALQISAGNLNKAQVTAQFGKGVAKQAQRGADRFETLFNDTDNLNMSAMTQLPEFRASSDAGALAYWFTRANEIGDKTIRHGMKRDIFAVTLGNKQAGARLTQSRADLSNEMLRMSEPIETTQGAALFKWDDNGQGVVDFFNTEAKHAEVNVKADRINAEMLRLDRLHETAATSSKFGRDALDVAQFNTRMTHLTESVMVDGLGSRPIRVVKGTVGKAAPGYVNVVDATDGADSLRLILSNASAMPAAQRTALMDEFTSAPTRGARNLVAQKAEAQVFQAYGEKYGKSAKDIQALMKASAGRRDTYRGSLKSRLYSAAPDVNYVAHIDEEGYVHAFDRPFLKSQLEDMVPMTDPTMIEKALKSDARTGWIGNIHTRAEHGGDMLDSVGMAATRLWKDSALFRVAYPLRVQVDTQLRLIAALGSLDYVTSAGRGARNLLHNSDFVAKDLGRLTGAADDDIVKATDLMRSKMYKGVETAPARTADELGTVHRGLESSNALALVLGDHSAETLRGLRSSGQWDVLQGSAPNWAEAQLRSVNKQIRNSPTASFMLTASDKDAARFIQDNPAARAEWSDFKSQYDSVEEWVGTIRSHINHTLPHPDLRIAAAERSLNADDLAKYFNDVTMRPAVHGEALVPFTKTAVGAAYNKVRTNWYKFASDAPETVMGRHPLYNARFREHMKQIVDRHDGDLTPEMVANARKGADKMARRDVSDTMFDLSKTSNMSHMLRFVSPFYAAWEDTMMKWTRLAYDDPSRAVRFGQAWTAADKADVVTKDDKGVEYIVLPKQLSPFLPKGAEAWRIRKDSFNIVFQGAPWWLPGFGPMVQVPTNEIVLKSFPQHADDSVMKYVLPFGVEEQGVAQQLMPGWAKRAKAAFSQSSSDYASTYAMLMAQETTKFGLGQRKTKPTVDEVANQTRNWHIMRALTAFASPVSIAPQPELQFYVDQAHDYRSKYGMDWQDQFYQDFPDYFLMSVSLSKNNTGITASDRAFDAYKKPAMRKAIAANPEYGWFFLGPENTGEFSQGVYANQASQALGYGNTMTSRTKKNPVEALADAEAQKGWMDYRKGSTAIQLELEARGLKSLNSKGAEDLAAAKKRFVSGLGAENNSWADAFGKRDPGKIDSFLRMVNEATTKTPSLAKRPDIAAVSEYIQGRRAIRSVLMSRKQTSMASNPDLQQAWDAFTAQLVANNIGFEQTFQRVLEADTLGSDL